MSSNYDLIIIGTGAGGGTLAHALSSTGKKILIIERGDFLPREKENWSPKALFVDERYHPNEQWLDANHHPFVPGTHYFVGGNTKFYGAALLRFRERDFGEVEHFGGVSPAWPLTYKDFQPYYLRAEELYHVHGQRGEDPTEPKESNPYPYPAVSHEPAVDSIYKQLHEEGVKAFHLPVGIHLQENNREKSPCIRCDTCDGFPCLVDAKSDAHVTCIRPALQSPNVTLLTKAKALRLETTNDGKHIKQVVVEIDGKEQTFSADTFVVSCGAINSAVLLLRSANDKHPKGLANSSGVVGTRYMCHNNSAIIALSPHFNPTQFQKTIGINDFYFGADDSPHPLGHMQLLGKVQPEMLEGDAPKMTPMKVFREMADHSMGWWITSEDLPDPHNRVLITPQGQIQLDYKANNLEAHTRLLDKLKVILEKFGHTHIFPNAIYLSKKIPLAGVAHQAGTCCFGTDPTKSVLDIHCKAHDLDNLYVVDGSFFPSISGVNPALTIIANSLRVADHLKGLK